MKARYRVTGIAVGTLALAGLVSAARAQSLDDAKKHIRHVVVIFQENVSFDHYFGTYPVALNPPGEPVFTALPGTPRVDGYTNDLLERNPNFLNPANEKGRSNPFRLDRKDAATADQDHNYTAEQRAFNGGKMDLFPLSVGRPDGPRIPGKHHPVADTSGLTMGYFDGNTVTAYWDYAQRFAMSDSYFGVVFGPSTPGAINLISGTTNGAVNDGNAQGGIVADGGGGFTMISDPNPTGDLCTSTTDAQVHMLGRNIGNVLNDHSVSWGWFQGGFDLSLVNENGTTGCRRSSTSPYIQLPKRDYTVYHQPFQYYPSTANPKHLRPASVKLIGTQQDTAANHQYDTHDFFDAVGAGNFPAVTFLKATAAEDGHSGNSTPLDEQRWVVKVLNFLQKQPEWESTVVFITYDDSDGWYDHRMAKVTNGSDTPRDVLDGVGHCGDGSKALPGVSPETKHAQGRCGPGPRLPLIVVSPWAKRNFVDHTMTDQTSIMRFVEDVFAKGERVGGGSFDAQAGPLLQMFDFHGGKAKNRDPLMLDPETGTVAR